MRISFSFFSVLLAFLTMLCFPFEAGAADKKFKIVIDAGHGGKDVGALGSFLKEKNINLDVALELGRLLSQEKDIEVIYTRKTDVFIPLDERSRIANKAKADLFISIHTNAAKSKSAFGTETYVVGSSATKANMEVAMRENSVILYEDDYKTRYEGFDPNSSESYIMFEFMQFAYRDQSLNLASCVQEEFESACKRSDRGVRQAGFWVLKQTGMPSILVELGYITNADEENYLSRKESKDALAQAVYNAFLTYKKNYEKKNNVAFDVSDDLKGADVEQPADTDSNKMPDAKTADDDKTMDKGLIYSIQFYTSAKSLPANSKIFKSYVPAKKYIENGIYKYRYGNVTTYREAMDLRKKMQKDFKDAFIVVFKDGKKLSAVEAKKYYK